MTSNNWLNSQRKTMRWKALCRWKMTVSMGNYRVSMLSPIIQWRATMSFFRRPLWSKILTRISSERNLMRRRHTFLVKSIWIQLRSRLTGLRSPISFSMDTANKLLQTSKSSERWIWLKALASMMMISIRIDWLISWRKSLRLGEGCRLWGTSQRIIR